VAYLTLEETLADVLSVRDRGEDTAKVLGKIEDPAELDVELSVVLHATQTIGMRTIENSVFRYFLMLNFFISFSFYYVH